MDYESYEYEDGYIPSEFDLKINEVIESEVERRVNGIKTKYQHREDMISKLTKENMILKEENKTLQKLTKEYCAFTQFKSLVSPKNFSSLLTWFDLKRGKFEINGMDSEEIPQWFKLLFVYYDDREKLFSLMDLFDIKYSTWAKEYKMPYEYTQEELEIFIDPKYDRYICNGEIFKNNIGFFWSNIELNKGNTYKILTNKSFFSDYIPWQLVLSNPLWSGDKLFNKILEAIREKQSNSQYFFTIQNYQNLSKEQVLELAKLLPKDRLYNEHKKFIENNKNIIKDNAWLAEKFKDVINDDQYSTFYYLNYPLEMQKEFIRKYSKSYYSKLDLIKRMNITKEEKLEFLQEFAEQELK